MIALLLWDVLPRDPEEEREQAEENTRLSMMPVGRGWLRLSVDDVTEIERRRGRLDREERRAA